MTIDVTPECIHGDRAACRRVVAAILRQLRNSPTGKPRDRNNPRKTLYNELRVKRKLSRWSIVNEVAWYLMNALRYAGFLDELRTRRDVLEELLADSGTNEADALIGLMAMHHADVFWTLYTEGQEDVKAILRESVENMLFPLVKTIEAKENFSRAVGVDLDHTNIPKRALNHITAVLCSLFSERTGKPRHGLVGQLLYQVGMEEPVCARKDRYKTIRIRVNDRMAQRRKRVAP